MIYIRPNCNGTEFELMVERTDSTGTFYCSLHSRYATLEEAVAAKEKIAEENERR